MFLGLEDERALFLYGSSMIIHMMIVIILWYYHTKIILQPYFNYYYYANHTVQRVGEHRCQRKLMIFIPDRPVGRSTKTYPC